MAASSGWAGTTSAVIKMTNPRLTGFKKFLMRRMRFSSIGDACVT
jgi:hypothetical protein